MTVTEAATKTCSRCGEDKPLSEFYRDRSSPSGRRGACKACVIDTASDWQRNNRDRRAEYMREYRRNHPERVRSGRPQREAYRAAESRLREAHRAEFDRLYEEELRKRGLR